MSNESFQPEFNMLKELGESTFVLRGSTLIVEILPKEEIRTKGGIITATPSDHVRGGSVTAHAVDVARVLMCGQGYDEDTEVPMQDGSTRVISHKVQLEVKPGAVILLPQYASQLLSHFPGISRPTMNKLAMVKMDQVMAYYPSEEAYNLAKAKLNA